MNLIIYAVRHFSQVNGNTSDMDAPLTEASRRDLPSFANRIVEVVDTMGSVTVLSSRAVRTREMAEPIAEQFGVVATQVGWLYGTEAITLEILSQSLAVIGSGAVILCCHEPDIRSLLRLAEDVDWGLVPVPHAGVFEFEFSSKARSLSYSGRRL